MKKNKLFRPLNLDEIMWRILILSFAFLLLALLLSKIITLSTNSNTDNAFSVVILFVGGGFLLVVWWMLFFNYKGKIWTKICSTTCLLISLAILVVFGYYSFRVNTENGTVVSVSWKYTIPIYLEEQVSNNDNTWTTELVKVREVTTIGENRKPYWGEFSLNENEKEGNRQELYNFTIRTENDVLKIYKCDKETWDLIRIDDVVEFEYNKNDNYITKIYND